MDSSNRIMDLKLELNSDGIYDFTLDNGGIAFDTSLDSLIPFLILTNAFDGEYPKNKKEGWKGGDLTSFIWKFKHTILTNETSLDIEDTLRNALQPLIEENICSNITVSSTISGNIISVIITYFDIRGNENGKYNIAFELSGT